MEKMTLEEYRCKVNEDNEALQKQWKELKDYPSDEQAASLLDEVLRFSPSNPRGITDLDEGMLVDIFIIHNNFLINVDQIEKLLNKRYRDDKI